MALLRQIFTRFCHFGPSNSESLYREQLEARSRLLDTCFNPVKDISTTLLLWQDPIHLNGSYLAAVMPAKLKTWYKYCFCSP